MTKLKKRVSFGSRLGAIAATVGSAVGLGNIWRFPYEAGMNGGGAFIIVYIICVALLGIPVVLSEFIIGRSTHKNMKGALKQLAPGSKVYHFTTICIIGAVVTVSFYAVVCGWVMAYLLEALAGHLSNHTPEQYDTMFSSLVSSPWQNVGWTLLFLAINFWVMRRGIKHGIERVSSIMMPLLLVLLLVFCVHALLLPGAGEGVRFLFSPDFSKLTWHGVVDAFGQAFMSLTLGISGLVTYSSYFKDDAPLVRDATIIAGLDTLIAVLAGLMIFPAVFAFGMQPEAGPKLLFGVMPSIFEQMTGGYLWAVLFFVLVFFAALTSSISLSEIAITYFIEEYHVSRNRATLWCSGIVVVLALLCALSFNVLAGVKLAGMNIFDLFNFAASNVFMLLGGLFTAIFVGWFLDRRVITEQLTNHGTMRTRMQGYVIFCLRYVAPVAMIFIFLSFVGII